MAKYKALRDTLLSHECRVAKAGEVFETTFPEVDGKPMKIGDNLELLSGDAPKGGSKKTEA